MSGAITYKSMFCGHFCVVKVANKMGFHQLQQLLIREAITLFKDNEVIPTRRGN